MTATTLQLDSSLGGVDLTRDKAPSPLVRALLGIVRPQVTVTVPGLPPFIHAPYGAPLAGPDRLLLLAAIGVGFYFLAKAIA